MDPQDFPARFRAELESRPCVLLVGQDGPRRRVVEEYLARQNLAVACEGRGDAALARMADVSPSLVVIEAEAPGLGAQDFCRRLRAEGNGIPVVVLAAQEDLVDHVVCLELGADACLSGDVPQRLLWAQVKALLRRAGAGDAGGARNGQELRCGALVLDRGAMELRFRGQWINLTPHEFDCAWLLAERAGTVVSREEFRGAMSRQGAGRIRDRSVDVCVSRLRRKMRRLEPDSRRIRSVRSQGYVFSLAGL